jgi:hypothetical protein
VYDDVGGQEQELEHEQVAKPEGGAGQEQGHEVPPPPPPPNLADMMAVQTQLMQMITQLLAQNNNNNNNNNHRGQHRNAPEGFQKKVENFNKLRSPTFDHSADPMDVDNWLREIEKKLELTELTEEECVTVVAHQLIGTAIAWWDSYCDSHPDPLHIGWDEFVVAFRNHHIPEAVMDRKADEFRHHKMGGMSVQEYANCYQELMRYVPNDTNTEKKKVYWFRKGLHKGLAHHLSAHDCRTLRSIINKALIVERSRLEYMEVRGSKSKRTDQAGCSGPPQRQRTGYSQGHQTQQRHHSTQSQSQSKANPGGSGEPNNWRPRPPPQSANRAKVTCFNYRQVGHKSF